ncbi:ABC transporter permease [Shinella granuli]|jgi:octopine/nopaline transport system permease protein|uniref:Amino acid ABC transporter membrane protein 1 (PAAT family) n=1 Tax=Shinella granuli TaxID=323621 RepID=A0A4R2CTE0_SHIGR|nr:ABC transporter permease [Shinella granuli]TCN43552.1 amino acid ABC transporter membrane protein 1 (PAAT family) [Shinella granuli]
MSVLDGWWDDFFFGLMTVLQVFSVALVIAVACGLLGASAKLSKSRILRAIAQAYTVVFRGAPELLVLLLFYFGMAITLTSIVQAFDPSVKFIDLPPFWAGSIAIGLIVGAYMTETFRGAFLGVDRGQIEAARALSLKRHQIFRYVRLPQMWRLALPNFGNHMLSIMKDTALVSIIGLEEILFVAKMANSLIHRPFLLYMTVALIYLAMTTVITFAVGWLEQRANRHLRGAR